MFGRMMFSRCSSRSSDDENVVTLSATGFLCGMSSPVRDFLGGSIGFAEKITHTPRWGVCAVRSLFRDP